jgi:hypothetical protein
MTQPVLVWANETLVHCPACLHPFWSFLWSKALAGDTVDVYELVGHCEQCSRYWVIGYTHEPKGTP